MSPNEQTTRGKAPFMPEPALPQTEQEWKHRLTPQQFHILRRGGTEPSYSGDYLDHKEDGIYLCAGCALPLYDSTTKYDACGWPSFWAGIPNAVEMREGLEAVCARCGGHLGHIFDDGPPPTGKRH